MLGCMGPCHMHGGLFMRHCPHMQAAGYLWGVADGAL